MIKFFILSILNYILIWNIKFSNTWVFKHRFFFVLNWFKNWFLFFIKISETRRSLLLFLNKINSLVLWFCYKHWILMLFFFISCGLNRFLIIYLNLWHNLIFINFWNILWTNWLHNILIGWNVIFSIFFNLFHTYWIPLLLVLFYFLFNWAFNLKLYFFISCWWIILSIIIFGFYFETMFVQRKTWFQHYIYIIYSKFKLC